MRLSKGISLGIVLFFVLSGLTLLCAYAQVPASEQTVQPDGSPQEKVKEVKAQTEAVKKEAEIQQKALELEKQKAELKLKEAEAAKKEAAIITQTATSKQEQLEATEMAKQKEKEAQAALDKVKIAEEKMLAAQEAARIAEEELSLAHERAAIAEGVLMIGRNILYRKLALTGLVLFLGYLLIFIIVGIINRRVKELKVKHVLRKNVAYLINFLILLFILFVWLQDISSVTIILSAIGAGLALALQEVLLSIAGWFLILIRKPFVVGDRIELGGIKGDVIDIRLFQTSLLEIGNWVDADQSTGRIVNVPNSAIFKKENFNYSRGFEFIWNEIPIVVTFESDYKRAEEIMLKHAIKEEEGMEDIVKRKIDRMTNEYMIYYDKFSPIVYVNIKDSGVELTLRYLTEARKRRSTQDRLCRAILDDFEKEEKVNFAYTTYRIVK